MGGRAPRVPPGGYKRPPSRIPPAGGGGVVTRRYSPGGPLAGPPAPHYVGRQGDGTCPVCHRIACQCDRFAPKPACQIRVADPATGRAWVAWFDVAGRLLSATSGFLETYRADPAAAEIRFLAGSTGVTEAAIARRHRDALHEAQGAAQRQAEADLVAEARQVADGLFAGTGGLLDPQRPQFVDWGSSEDPDERVRADRKAAREALPPTRIGRWSAYVVGVLLVLLATGSVGRLLGAADWAVLVVSTLLVLAGVLAVAVPVGRRRYRRQLDAERRALAERADRENQEWMNR